MDGLGIICIVKFTIQKSNLGMERNMKTLGKLAGVAIASATLVACGGGGSEGANVGQEAVAVFNDLQAALGTSSTTTFTSLCGHDVGPNRIEGTVTKVHDGDTITVNGSTIRLDGIDAPELAQTYGAQSQASLSRLVMGHPVTVAYTKTDKYGRIVGTVFTSACQHANLEQVANGSAWFYRAYQCELSSSDRTLFDQSEATAKAARYGLWADTSPLPPWIYRNGVDATVPSCSTNSPSWVGNPLPPSTPTYIPPTNPSCYTIYVDGYYRSNGTYVKPYTRKSPGCP